MYAVGWIDFPNIKIHTQRHVLLNKIKIVVLFPHTFEYRTNDKILYKKSIFNIKEQIFEYLKQCGNENVTMPQV